MPNPYRALSVMLTTALDTWVGHNIRDFCTESGPRQRDSTYHCAHFAGHVLGLQERGSHLIEDSVGRIAGQCSNFRQLILPVPGSATYPQVIGLIYVTPANHVHITGSGPANRCRRIDSPRHIGFYVNGVVWHYENDSRYEQVVTYFLNAIHPVGSRFHNRYGPGCELWVSDFPPGHFPRPYAGPEMYF